MSFKDLIYESKYVEGDRVKWDHETWEVIEVIGNKKLKLSSLDGKQHIIVFTREVKDINKKK